MKHVTTIAEAMAVRMRSVGGAYTVGCATPLLAPVPFHSPTTPAALMEPCVRGSHVAQMMESVASCRWDWVRFCRFGAMLLAAWRCMKFRMENGEIDPKTSGRKP